MTFSFSSSHILMDALGDTLTPFRPVCCQYFSFLHGDIHLIQVAFDHIHPVFSWPSKFQASICSLSDPNAWPDEGFWSSPFVGRAPASLIFFLWLYLLTSVSLFSFWCHRFFTLSLRVMPSSKLDRQWRSRSFRDLDIRSNCLILCLEGGCNGAS